METAQAEEGHEDPKNRLISEILAFSYEALCRLAEQLTDGRLSNMDHVRTVQASATLIDAITPLILKYETESGAFDLARLLSMPPGEKTGKKYVREPLSRLTRVLQRHGNPMLETMTIEDGDST